MKTFISILTLAVFSLLFHGQINAQNDDTEYVVVDYMKVKPGMHDKYLECEQAWKLIHQQFVKEGKITGWSFERVVYPSGTDTEYDYITITHYKNWESMNTQNRMPLDEVFAALPEDKRAAAENFAEYRDMVKSEIWTTNDLAFAAGDTSPRYAV
ncbi:MAG: hypothetical protein ACE5FF_14140, partial [Saprospiraceae bacterium]